MHLSKRQKKAAEKLVNARGGCVWWKVGQGKTRIALKIFATLAKAEASKFLVVCRREAFSTWTNEVKQQLQDSWKVIELENMFGVWTPTHAKKKVIFLLSSGMIAKFSEEVDYPFDGVCLDEGYLYKNPRAERTKAAHQISDLSNFNFLLSGSIMTAHNLDDIYGQLFAIGKSELLARTLTEYRDKFSRTFYFGPQSNPIPRRFNRRGAVAIVANKVRAISSVYMPKSPRKIKHIIRYVAPNPHQEYLMKMLRELYVLEFRKKHIELNTAPVIPLKAQQISNGWVHHNNRIEFIGSEKIGYVKYLVDQIIDAGEKVIIWCAFRRDVHYIHQQIEHPSATMVGGKKFDEEYWKQDGVNVAIATEASGSSVNYFDQCQYAIYFSMQPHWLHLQQSRGRTDRASSKHKTCYYYYIFTTGSFDRHIYRLAQTSGKKEREFITQAAIKTWLSRAL